MGDGGFVVQQKLDGHTNGGFGIQLVLESRRLVSQQSSQPRVAFQWLRRGAEDNRKLADV